MNGASRNGSDDFLKLQTYVPIGTYECTYPEHIQIHIRIHTRIPCTYTFSYTYRSIPIPHIHIDTSIHPYIHRCIHALMHPNIQSYKNHTNIYTHTLKQTQRQTYQHANIPTYKHTNIPIHTHTNIQT